MKSLAKFFCADNVWKRFTRRSLRALRLRICAPWHTKGIYSETVEIACKKKTCSEKVCKRFPRRSLKALRLGIGALWHTRGVYPEIIKSLAKKLLRKILKAIPTALTQSLEDRAWRPLACERKLLRKYKKRWQTFSAPNIFESDSHGAHSEPQGVGLAPFGIRTEFN